MKILKCYKLVRLRKNNTLGSLFIYRKAVLPINQWLIAELHPTKGYAERFGWHCTFYPYAPHLKETGRIWVECLADGYRTYARPKSQGGTWILADYIKIISILSHDDVNLLNQKRRLSDI